MSGPSSLPPPEALRLTRLLPSVRNMAAAYFGAAAEGVAFLLLTPFLVRRLGIESFGVFALAVALADWLQLFDFGLREGVMKYAAAHQARSDAAAVRRLADTALVLYLGAAALALAATAAVAAFGLPRLLGDPSQLADARAVLVVLGLTVAVSLPAGVAGALLEGLSRFDLINLFRTGHALLRLFLIVLALQMDLGLPGIALAELAGRLALHAWRWAAVYRIAPVLLPRPLLHVHERGHLLGFGVWNALRQVVEVLSLKLYEPLLAAFAGIGSVGAFYAGRRLGTMPAEIIVPMAAVVFPLSSEMQAAKRTGTLRQVFLKSTKFAFLASLPAALLLALGAGPIQINWLGNRAPEAEPVLMVFSVVFALVALAVPAESVLLGLGEARLLALVGLAQGAATILLGIPLTLRLGPAGLALAALLAVLATQVAVVLPRAAVRCGLRLTELLRRAILPPVLAGVPVAIVGYLLGPRLARGGLAALAAWGAGAMVSYGVLIWWIGFDEEERGFLRSHLRRLVIDTSKITDWEEIP